MATGSEAPLEEMEKGSMTPCHHFDGKVGYKGQKYAVVADKPDGSITCLGWQNKDKIERGSVWKLLAKHMRLTNPRLELVKPEDQK